MPLPSQTARVSAARTPMFRKRRRSLKPAGYAVAALGVVLAAWWAATRTGDPGTTAPTPLTETASPPTPTGPGPISAAPIKPDPVVIRPAANSIEPIPQPPVEISMASRRAPDPPPPAEQPPRAQEPTRPVSTDAPTPAIGDPSHPSPGSRPVDPAVPTEVQALVSAGRRRLAENDPVGARQLLSRALIDPRTPETERASLRDELTKLSEELVFSPRVAKDDPFVLTHTVQAGDVGLEKIARSRGLTTHWRLIQRVNRLADPNRIRLHQSLKLVKGPFHAIVNKAAFRMDIYLGDPQRPQDWVFVRSFPVGLGEGGSTPIGDFVVKKGSKLENPYWTNPRTGEQFSKDDPKNPIGERWIGLEGVGTAVSQTGYGIHGTIDPDSIGRQKSMGCVRLGAEDVELVYDLLGEGVSIVRVVP